MHAAEALLRLGRQVRPQRRHQGPEGQGRRHRPAHRARPGALHPLHPLHPRLRRGGQAARADDGQARRPRGADHRARAPAGQPLFAQHRRRLPGGRADRRRTSASPCAPGSCTSTPSVCPGCATGCNIEVQHSRDQIYRLVPRENPAVNKHWMCDEGRFTYKRVHGERLAAPLSGGTPVEWDRALEDAAQRAARRRWTRGAQPGRRGVLRAVDQRGPVRAGAAGVRPPAGRHAPTWPGWTRAGRDDILVSADKNPNTAGAHGHRRGPAAAACSIWPNDLKAGAVTALLVVGDAGRAGQGRRRRGAAARTAARRWSCSARTATRWSTAAHVALPLAEWAEVDGTFTNRLGMVQRVRAAMPPAGDSLPGWEILSHLARKLGATMEFARRRQGGRSSRPSRSCRS